LQRALDLIGETLGPLEAMANDEASPLAARARKMADLLRALALRVRQRHYHYRLCNVSTGGLGIA
jgi:hypothetical protein